MQDFYKTMSPEKLEQYAEKAGLGVKYPSDLKEIKKLIPKKYCRILEVGCGTGRLGIHLIKYPDYVGIDSYKTYLEYFKKRLNRKNIPFAEEQLQNVSFFNYNGKDFDVVLFPWTVIGDFTKKQQAKALVKAKNMLLDEGVIILDNPAKGEIYNNAHGYEPAKFYFDDWKSKFSDLGFAPAKQIFYTTATGRKREITFLRSDSGLVPLIRRSLKRKKYL